MSLICSRDRISDGEEGASSGVGEEALFAGMETMDHFEVLRHRRSPYGDKNVM